MKLPKLFSSLIVTFFIAAGLNAQPDTVHTGRFTRGTGNDPTYHSFVIALDFQKGLEMSNTNGLGLSLFPQYQNSSPVYYHYNATNPASENNISLRIPYQNPIVAFGSRVGGSSLYLGQPYKFAFYSGDPTNFPSDTIYIDVFNKADGNYIASFNVPLPNWTQTNQWTPFLTNGYTLTTNAWGLTTTISFENPFVTFGAERFGAFHVTHTGEGSAVNYTFGIEVKGSTDKGRLVKTDVGAGYWSRLYTLEFDERPPLRSVFIDQPHFQGEPLPPAYDGKSIQELLTNSFVVTNLVAVTNAPGTYINLDHSPELRRHPILDQFVTDMRKDPLALANYVQNEIALTDTMAWNDNGPISDTSINLGGVNRNALGVFQEGQGSPMEQCALLTYLLRQAGIPAVYAFAPENGLKMLDARLSKLLGFQVRNAVDNKGKPYRVNLALGKIATQSSTNNDGTAGLCLPGRAIDGNYDGTLANKSVSSTTNQANAWLEMDLVTTNAIGDILIWNRTDCCAVSNFFVLVSEAPFSSTSLSVVTNQAGVSNYYVGSLSGIDSYTVPVNRNGRYVRVQLAGTGILNLAEVQVLSSQTNTLIPVNYPWVAAYISNSWTHLFPWIKDTELTEGLNLYDVMPTNYNHGYDWARDFMYGKTNILSLDTNDLSAGDLYLNFIEQTLRTNQPGISMDDIGTHIVNRRRLYSRWTDFPTPTWVTNTNSVLESLSDALITNVNPNFTNIFDTVRIEISSVTNGLKIDTGNLRMADLHNRKFLLRHEKITSTQHRMILSLAPFSTNWTGNEFFTNSTALLKRQAITNTLGTTDYTLRLKATYTRHRAYTNATPLDLFIAYPQLYEEQVITREATLRKGDLAAICFDVGRVTGKMLNVHAQELWNMESLVQTNASATNTLSAEVYQGATAYLMGMSYYERLGRFWGKIQRLHKQQLISSFSVGLGKLSPTNMPNGDIDLVMPNLDMYLSEACIAANRSLRPDAGEDGPNVSASADILYACLGSAVEHQTINRFFKQTAAVSTVKLLQLAQQRGTNGQPGIIHLTSSNYLAMGTTNFGGVQLRSNDLSIWKEVTNAFALPQSQLTQVFITPGAITNGTSSYRGMGAFIIQPGLAYAAYIGGNQKGAFGGTVPDGSFGANNVVNWLLTLGADGSFGMDLKQPGANSTTTAPDVISRHNAQDGIDAANQNYYSYTDVQKYWVNDVLGGLGITTQPNLHQNYANSAQTTQSGAWMGGGGNPAQQTGSLLLDPVHAVTGEFYVDATDLSLPGPMPLQIRRNYSSHNLSHNQFGWGWKMSYMPSLSVSVEGSTNLIYAAEPDGAVVVYQKTATNVNLWLPSIPHNPQLDNFSTHGIGSTANLFRSRIEKQAGSPVVYKLFSPGGSVRTFETKTFAGAFTRTFPALIEWKDNRGNFYTFEWGADSTQADFGEVRRIQSSNGNFLGFYYDAYGHIVEAYTGDGRRLFYDYDAFGDLIGVTLPDASEITFDYEHKTQSVTNAGIVTIETYSTHLITQENKPDGRALVNQYDSQRRVTNQLSTVGLDLVPIRNGTFVYSNNFNLSNALTATISGFTFVVDIFNKTNRYDYTNGLITKITDPLNQTIEQLWYATNAVVPGHPRSLWKKKDQRGLWTEFFYDSFGNATTNIVTGDLTGTGSTSEQATNITTYNENHLPLVITDPIGNKISNVYSGTFSFLPEQVVRYASATPISTNLYTYYNVTNTFSYGGITYTDLANGLLQKEIQAHNSSDAATNEWTHDGRGWITQQFQYTGTSDPTVTNSFFYNARGELVEKTDAAGRKVKFDYDGMSRLKLKEVYETGQTTPLSWEYSYYNENGEPTWSDGPRYDPEDYSWIDYDGAGRVIEEIRWQSQAKSDGSGVEAKPGYSLFATTFREHDGFGNMTKVTDPNGNYRTMDYDAIGQMIREKFYDAAGTALATNQYAYEPGGLLQTTTNALGGITKKFYTSRGQLRRQENPDGSTNGWTYYLNGRACKEIQANGAFREMTYNDLTLTTSNIFYTAGNSPLATNVTVLDRRGNMVTTIDAFGKVFTNAFDDLNRLKLAAGPSIASVFVTGIDPFGTNYVTNIVQQRIGYNYDASGTVLTTTNALDEKTITTFDALQRPVSVEVRSTNNTQIRVTSTAYALNHHSVTVTNGTGGGAIVTTTFTDNGGHTVLSLAYPTANVREFTRSVFDGAGNLSSQLKQTATNSAVTTWQTSTFVYDGLNRVITNAALDNAITVSRYNALGNLTNQVMPGGSLTWLATYNNAGQILTEQDKNGAHTTRNISYAYYPSGNQWAGLLKTVTEGNGVIRTNLYDDYLRIATVNTTGTLDEQKMSRSWQYDARGLLTNITQVFTNPATGPTNIVVRKFDEYSQLLSENVLLSNSIVTTAGQSWSAAGRRRMQTAGMLFDYRADDLMSAVNSATFGYGNNGLMVGRTNGTRIITIDSRDGVGRPLQVTTKVNGSTVMTETWTWTGDGLPDVYTATRSDFTDTRRFTYGASHRRLTQETHNLGAGQSVTNVYQFDSGTAGGMGALTKVSPASGAAIWSGSLDSFSRVVLGTNTVIHRTADGTVNGAANLRGVLNGKSVDVRFDPRTTGIWTADMALSAATNTLIVYADHPSGGFTTNKQVTFTISGGSFDKEESQYDGAGNVTNRVWKRADGQIVRTQSLVWNAFGELVKVNERDAITNGFNLVSVFDGLGRQIQTIETTITNSVVLSSNPAPLVLTFTYDPQMEFLIAGIKISQGSLSRQDWLAHGPDLSGRYGGMQGIGGLETITTHGPHASSSAVINDAFGNVIAVVTNGAVSPTWNTARLNLYAPAEGYAPPRPSLTTPAYTYLAWRTRPLTAAGLVQLGLRPYDPVRRAFMAVDSLGHGSDWALNTAFGGNPTVIFDADGRLGKRWTEHSQSVNVNSVGSFFDASFSGAAGAILQGMGSIPSVFGQTREGMANAREEINGYSGGQAFLARSLMLPADIAFGTASLVNDPVNTVSGMPQGFVNFGGKIGTDVYNVGVNPSVNTVFNIGEDALGVFGITTGVARGLTTSGVTAPLENFAAKTYLQAAKGAQWESYYNSFTPGTARLNVTLGGDTLFRAANSEGAASFGEFASREQPATPLQAIQGNALDPALTGNRAGLLFQVTTRPGFSLSGTAAAQSTGYPGGFTQVFQSARPGVPTWSSVQPIPYSGVPR